MGPTGCPDMPVHNYRSMLCKIPEDRRSPLHHGGRQISHEREKKLGVLYCIYRPGSMKLTHCRRVMQICVFTLQLCKMDDANLRF